MTLNKIRTRGNDPKYELLPTVDGIWKEKVFDPPVNKLRIFSDGSFGIPTPEVEIKIDNVEGSFIIGVVHDLEIDDHIVTRVQYRLKSGTNGLISITGFRIEESD
jgi:hypothetical protein